MRQLARFTAKFYIIGGLALYCANLVAYGFVRLSSDPDTIARADIVLTILYLCLGLLFVGGLVHFSWQKHYIESADRIIKFSGGQVFADSIQRHLANQAARANGSHWAWAERRRVNMNALLSKLGFKVHAFHRLVDA